MPRQARSDLSYFTLDCNIFEKTADLRPLLRKFKADGLAVYVHILCDVYGTGYYFKPDDYEGYIIDVAEDCGMSEEKVQLIIAFMADRTLLDAFSLNKNTVFTSHGIQKRYAEAMKGRKRKIAEIKGDYWLLTEEEERKIETFYKSQPFADKSEKMDDKSEKMDDKSEIYLTTEHNITEHNITEHNITEHNITEERKKERKQIPYSEFSEMTDEELIEYGESPIDLFKEENHELLMDYHEEIKRRKKVRESTWKGKTTSDFRKLESHKEIMDEMCVVGYYRETLENFLRYCYANGHTVMNDKLVDIICCLQEYYGDDNAKKMKSLERAMSGGYYDIWERRQNYEF